MNDLKSTTQKPVNISIYINKKHKHKYNWLKALTSRWDSKCHVQEKK